MSKGSQTFFRYIFIYICYYIQILGHKLSKCQKLQCFQSPHKFLAKVKSLVENYFESWINSDLWRLPLHPTRTNFSHIVQNPNIIWRRTFLCSESKYYMKENFSLFRIQILLGELLFQIPLELFSLITKYYQNFDSKHYQKSSRITKESFPCSDSKYHHNSLSLILEELFIVQNPNKYDYKRRNRSKK